MTVFPATGGRDVHTVRFGGAERPDQVEVLVVGAVDYALSAAATARALSFTVVHLTEPTVRALYGTGNVLIRPDQHVAWRADRLPIGGAAAVYDRVLGGPVEHRRDASDHVLAGARA